MEGSCMEKWGIHEDQNAQNKWIINPRYTP